MKVKDYNPKAREAFGKTLVDVGVAIFKGTLLLVTVVPLGLFAKTVMERAEQSISVIDFLSKVTIGTYIIFVVLLILSFFIGDWLRREGLRHIHESENL